ncbi:hypothetical protein D8674_012155 [Pyrus ussuriensis x Pyrus communis]|uniref:Uncharacterized protein n=1 Tax=Pyrus ussuriensis x Pyrus communis TaxID=2448454 RepID=A0A5N5G1I7_9ROSA|nr:hypothetical protein D8674_012155 [Pyrus ussuriensis x Pyrus communis]
MSLITRIAVQSARLILMFSLRVLDSFSSQSGVDTEESNEIIQMRSMGNALRGNRLTTEELDPQALVYKTLWLDAEAELRSMKHKLVSNAHNWKWVAAD